MKFNRKETYLIMRELIFEDLKFTNFKCYDELDFNFIPNRFSVITGNNGSGKTTIFDALCYALYDTTTKGIRGDNVIRRKVGKNLSVILKFKINEDNYEIRNYRKHSKYKDGKFLFLNGKDITENSRKATNDKISQILMPQEVFTNCLLFSQFINKSFLELTNSGLLDKILDLEKYEEYWNITNESIKIYLLDIKSYEQSIILQEKEIFSSKELLEQNKKFHIETIDRYNNEELKLKNEIENLNKFILDNQENIKKYLDKEEERLKINDKLNQVNSQIEKQREECLLNLQTCKNNYKEQENNLKTVIIEKYSKLNEESINKKNETEDRVLKGKNYIYNLKSQVLNEIENIKKEKNENLEKEINELNNKKEKLLTKEQDIFKEEQKISIQNEKNKKEIQNLNKFLNKEIPICFTCKQEIKDEQHLTDVKNEIDKLTIQIETDELRLNQRKLELEKIIKDKKNIEVEIEIIKDKFKKETSQLVNNKNSGLNQKVSLYESKISEFVKVISNLNNVIEQNKKKMDDEIHQVHNNIETSYNKDSEKIKELAKIKASDLLKKKDEVQKTLDKIQNEFEKLHSIYLKVNETKTTIRLKTDQIEKNKEKLKIELQNIEKNINSINEKIKNKEQEIINLKLSIQSKIRKNEILTFWKSAFSDTGIKSILLDESLPILNEKARELSNLTDCIKVSFDSQKALKSGDLRDKFTINVLQTKNLSDFNELSAGETRMANIIILLCLRHLMETIQGLRMNVLLLDEILDTLDQDNAALAVGMIKRLSEDHCVVLISHTLRNFIDADEELAL